MAGVIYHLRDLGAELAAAWHRHFVGVPNIVPATRRHNDKHPGTIRSVSCPGMGTGTGEIPAGVCAKPMRAAWDEVDGGQPFQPTGVNDALMQHFRLLRDE